MTVWIEQSFNPGIVLMHMMLRNTGTHVGAQWGGLWQAESAAAFAEDAAQLYTSESLWTSCQTEGADAIN